MNPDTALINCSLVDTEYGCILKDRTILAGPGAGGRGVIADILPFALAPEGCRTIDLSGMFVMPGLIDAHVHLFFSGTPVKKTPGETQQKIICSLLGTAPAKALLKQSMKARALTMLHAGVTTIRCVGDPYYLDIDIASEVASGLYPGPRMIAAGYMVSVTGGHGAPFLALTGDTPELLREIVRKNRDRGADLIKICVTGGVVESRRGGMPQMTASQVLAVCEEAHSLGLTVAAHAESMEGVRNALRGGADTIEHGSVLDEEMIGLFLNNPRSLRGYSALVPTLHGFMPGRLDPEKTGFREEDLKNSREACENMIAGIKAAIGAGIKIGLGTDASMPYVTHYNTWRELDFLVRYAELTPAQALLNATASNAQILGLNYTGRLAAGMDADLLVLDGNPLKDLKTLSRPLMVVARGKWIVHPKVKKNGRIDALLDTLAPDRKKRQ
jgi:imidazolonepropionase-like amidohydrolase